MSDSNPDKPCINLIRFLSSDTIEKAKSSHIGLTKGFIALVYVLGCRFLKHNPGDPNWPARDRFVLTLGFYFLLLYILQDIVTETF